MRMIPQAIRRVLSSAVRRVGLDRRHRSNVTSLASSARVRSRPAHADERTIRRVAEEQLGGTSSQESREAYLRGDHPGGLHEGGHGPATYKRQDEDE